MVKIFAGKIFIIVLVFNYLRIRAAELLSRNTTSTVVRKGQGTGHLVSQLKVPVLELHDLS
jgi:hypothetical protein